MRDRVDTLARMAREAKGASGASGPSFGERFLKATIQGLHPETRDPLPSPLRRFRRDFTPLPDGGPIGFALCWSPSCNWVRPPPSRSTRTPGMPTGWTSCRGRQPPHPRGGAEDPGAPLDGGVGSLQSPRGFRGQVRNIRLRQWLFCESERVGSPGPCPGFEPFEAVGIPMTTRNKSLICDIHPMGAINASEGDSHVQDMPMACDGPRIGEWMSA